MTPEVMLFLFCLRLKAAILHGNEIISKLCVIAVQMPTLWHQCKRDATYAPWPRGTKDFMQCMRHSMGKGKCQMFFTAYVLYFLLYSVGTFLFFFLCAFTLMVYWASCNAC